ncbi:hypothetical protein GUJ93_ZPchr0005g15433 [Zizania palustris]|uniref:Auxin-responsive protein n=1 Tax=Zizania palustris TaxID=103762 RepID=A0A8J5SUE2_ZIZPA|nr:hypothetical protein GUJ93_ZPchr0005g15433 [Zizania palustris]
MEGKASDHESPPSSMDSCSSQRPPSPALSTASSGCLPATRRRRGLCTDLHLGLTLSSCSSVQTDSSTPSTPSSAVTTATTATTADHDDGGGGGGHGRRRSLFVKVYMEGVPIGRKLDLLPLDGYSGLRAQLAAMFKASIAHPGAKDRHQQQLVGGGERSKKKTRDHVLTYEDQEGDWMMVGDVPWEYGYYIYKLSDHQMLFLFNYLSDCSSNCSMRLLFNPSFFFLLMGRQFLASVKRLRIARADDPYCNAE